MFDLAPANYIQYRSLSGCSAARLARFVRDEEAGGSNPLTPTIYKSFRILHLQDTHLAVVRL